MGNTSSLRDILEMQKSDEIGVSGCFGDHYRIYRDVLYILIIYYTQDITNKNPERISVVL
jgi:hypothetical protein